MAIFRSKRDVNANIRVTTNNNVVLSGLHIIDGLVLQENDLVLVKDQVDKTQNGVYIVKRGEWIRSNYYDENSELSIGNIFYVSGGVINRDSFWILSSNATGNINIGEHEIYFKNISQSIVLNENGSFSKNEVGEIDLKDVVEPGEYFGVRVNEKGLVVGGSAIGELEPESIKQNSENRFVTDEEKSEWSNPYIVSNIEPTGAKSNIIWVDTSV